METKTEIKSQFLKANSGLKTRRMQSLKIYLINNQLYVMILESVSRIEIGHINTSSTLENIIVCSPVGSWTNNMSHSPKDISK